MKSLARADGGSTAHGLVGKAMKTLKIGLFSIIALAWGCSVSVAADPLAIKSGETVLLSTVYWVVNCHSMLKGPMTVEILEGPPEITAAIVERDVVPHTSDCAKSVKGGLLNLTAAADVKTKIHSEIVLRVKYPTEDGVRQKSFIIAAVVVP